jgi:hypothetical protein
MKPRSMCRCARAEERIIKHYLWQYGRSGACVVFAFRLGRGREGPKRFLGQFEGILQTDSYTAYDQIGGGLLPSALKGSIACLHRFQICCWVMVV